MEYLLCAIGITAGWILRGLYSDLKQIICYKIECDAKKEAIKNFKVSFADFSEEFKGAEEKKSPPSEAN